LQLDATGQIEATFVYGTHVNVPDSIVLRSGTVYRLLTDQLGTVRLVVDAAKGGIVQRLDYDAVGNVTSNVLSLSGFTQPFGFAGGLYDADTGLVRFGARDYDAVTGRWTAKDLSLFGGEDTNLYQYGFGDPNNYIDPEGKVANIVGGAVMGAGLDLGLQLLINGGNLACVDWAQVAIAGAAGAAGVGIFDKLNRLRKGQALLKKFTSTQSARKFDMSKVQKFADQMQKGTWDWAKSDTKIIVDSTGKILDGHHRVAAAARAGANIPGSAVETISGQTARAPFSWPSGTLW
jgi:RHS repeat-associated protein